MPKRSIERIVERNPRHRPMTAKEREDARDVAYIKAHRHEPFYSFNELCKELGFNDLVIPRPKKR